MMFNVRDVERRLKAVRFTEMQTKALLAILRDHRQPDQPQLATKADLELLKADLTIRVGAMIATGFGLLSFL